MKEETIKAKEETIEILKKLLEENKKTIKFLKKNIISLQCRNEAHDQLRKTFEELLDAFALSITSHHDQDRSKDIDAIKLHWNDKASRNKNRN